MSKAHNPLQSGKIWIALSALALLIVVVVAFLVPLGNLGPLGNWALTYGKRNNTFSVSDPTGRIVGADLRLCGAVQPLHRFDQVFTAEVPITCEGDGEVRLHFADGKQASCVVGYVTPGAVQHFNFEVNGNECA